MLKQKFCTPLQLQPRKQCRLVLALCWSFGLLYGVLAYCSAADILLALMHSCIYKTVSVVGLLCVNLIPFLLSALAVYFSSPLLLNVVCFGKASIGVMVSLAAMRIFGDCGWICRFLMLFSSWVGQILLYLFWLRIPMIFSEKSAICVWLLIGCFGIMLVDYCVISPFWACLIDF